MKKFTPSKAKLPDNERIIGGDAPRSAINQDRKKTMQEIIDKVEAEKREKDQSNNKN